MKTFNLSIAVLAGLSIIFGSIWAALLFCGYNPDGFKDATIGLISAVVSSVSTKLGIHHQMNKNKSKKKEL